MTPERERDSNEIIKNVMEIGDGEFNKNELRHCLNLLNTQTGTECLGCVPFCAKSWHKGKMSPHFHGKMLLLKQIKYTYVECFE